MRCFLFDPHLFVMTTDRNVQQLPDVTVARALPPNSIHIMCELGGAQRATFGARYKQTITVQQWLKEGANLWPVDSGPNGWERSCLRLFLRPIALAWIWTCLFLPVSVGWKNANGPHLSEDDYKLAGKHLAEWCPDESEASEIKAFCPELQTTLAQFCCENGALEVVKDEREEVDNVQPPSGGVPAASRNWVFRTDACFEGLARRRERIAKAEARLEHATEGSAKKIAAQATKDNEERFLAQQLGSCFDSLANFVYKNVKLVGWGADARKQLFGRLLATLVQPNQAKVKALGKSAARELAVDSNTGDSAPHH
mmetsp:Transcript_17064/g.39052  ORF Transcript_17064/g.39052 Transcript_17064/m.39052 type:complete len:312 (-) Transcript_17064:84-1019(-)